MKRQERVGEWQGMPLYEYRLPSHAIADMSESRLIDEDGVKYHLRHGCLTCNTDIHLVQLRLVPKDTEFDG